MGLRTGRACPSRPLLHLKAQPGNQYYSLCLAALPAFPPSLSYPRNSHFYTHTTFTHITMSTRSTRKRKNEEEELVELPEDSDAESEEE